MKLAIMIVRLWVSHRVTSSLIQNLWRRFMAFINLHIALEPRHIYHSPQIMKTCTSTLLQARDNGREHPPHLPQKTVHTNPIQNRHSVNLIDILGGKHEMAPATEDELVQGFLFVKFQYSLFFLFKANYH